MANSPHNQPPQLSVLDRLDSGRGSAPAGISDLRAAVRRDLERLLNTRWRSRTYPEQLKDELETSMVNYGTPDLTGANMGAATAREEFRRLIERVIQQYEPRLMRVRVEVLENTRKADRTMHFRIDAVLRVKPTPEPVTFDTALEPTTSTFSIERAE
jgi:type VI secretion system protein ImpF